MADAETTGSSTSAFVSALILYGIVGCVLFLLFTITRPKQPLVYQPKTIDTPNRSKDEQPPEVPGGPLAWASELWSRPQTFFLQYAGVDGYLYTRYVGIFCSVSFLGALVLLPVLLPVNATNGSDNDGFDLLSFANVTNNKRYYAHAFLSWFFFGLIIWIIYKELIFYTSLRHSIQTTPLYDGLLSSRTVLITDIPKDLYEESKLKEIFPHTSRIWYLRDNTELTLLVKQRDKLHSKYEATLNNVVRSSTKYHRKLVKKGKPIPESPEGLVQKQPTHRLGKIPFIGKKVETIEYSIEHLPELNEKITQLQADPDTKRKVGSVFMEFPSQLEAQRAYQSIPYHKMFKGDRAIGVAPTDIIWKNLALSRTSRTIKRVLANAFLTAMIIFWAIPVAIVGMISNITFLTEKIPFLSFINNCPDVLLGLITGILPTVALAILMALVPVVIKQAGKISGLPTLQAVDLYCQSWYYGFQVVQVFLVVTLASSASSTVTAIIDDPSSAMTLLAENLPKASNFYIAFFLLQGLYTPAFTILQAVPLLLTHALSFLLNTPRKKWNKTFNLAAPSFGVIYPPLQLLVVLYACYAMIAPIILIFSTLALALSYVVNLYLFTYVKGNGVADQRGRNYPKALLQTFVALYLAEICVLGLFIMAKTWGPIALEAIMLAVTVAAHIFLKHKFCSLYDIVPVSAILEARGDSLATYPKDHGLKEIEDTGKNYISDNSNYDDLDGYYSNKESTKTRSKKEGTPIQNNSISSRNDSFDQDRINQEQDIGQIAKDFKAAPKNVIQRFTNPSEGYSFNVIRAKLPTVLNKEPAYHPDFLETAYYDRAFASKEGAIWIPKDTHGVSTCEIEKAFGKVFISDQGAELNEEGKLNVTGNPPDFEVVIKV